MYLLPVVDWLKVMNQFLMHKSLMYKFLTHKSEVNKLIDRMYKYRDQFYDLSNLPQPFHGEVDMDDIWNR